MRILFIIPTLDNHGAEKQLSLLAPGLQRAGFDVSVCVLTRSGPHEATLQAAGVPVHVIGKRWKLDPQAFRNLKKHIQAVQPDVVQTFLFAANAYGRAAAWLAGVKHIVGSERCVDPWKQAYEHFIDRFLAKRSRAIIVNSSGVSDFYTKKGIAADKFRVIPNGIAPALSSDTSRQELLAELGLPADTRLIGAVNRLWPQKRVKDLIWAADLLKCVRDDVHLVIIGDGPHRARLERYQAQVRITDRVHFLGNRTDVPRLMPHFDCLWLGSGYEGMPNVVMEAMSHAVPVVATDIPGNRDLVVHGETGYLVPVGDRAAFARHTNRVLNDAELAKQLGQRGRERVEQDFSVEQMVQNYADFYQSLGVTASQPLA